MGRNTINVLEVRNLLAWGFSKTEVARKLGTTNYQVYKVVEDMKRLYHEEEKAKRPYGLERLNKQTA